MKIIKEIKVCTLTVMCNGGRSSLAHPKIYLNLEDKTQVICPYCSKKYIYDQYKK